MTFFVRIFIKTILPQMQFRFIGLFFACALVISCGNELVPLPERSDIPQPTFVAVDVTPAPESPTATPWPFRGDSSIQAGERTIPDGLDPSLYSPAEPDEVVSLWIDLLTGSSMNATSDRLFFRGAGRFGGELHLCPDGVGYLDGDPSGDADWSIEKSVGEWFEVAFTHEIPGRLESATFVLSIENGSPVRSGSTEAIDFVDSEFCSIADPSIELFAFTVDERRLDEQIEDFSDELPTIPWVNGERAFPEEILDESLSDSSEFSNTELWEEFLKGGAIEAVAYDYGTFVLTEAFSGSLHMCEGRVAVLDGSTSGVGEWAVESSGSSSSSAKIVFTLPGDRTLRTLSLTVLGDRPALMGRDHQTGLIAANVLELRESDECGG